MPVHASACFARVRADVSGTVRVHLDDMSVSEFAEVLADLCTEILGDTCTDMCMDVCIGMCTDMCTGLGVDICIDQCTDMCTDICTDMCTEMCINVYKAVDLVVADLLPLLCRVFIEQLPIKLLLCSSLTEHIFFLLSIQIQLFFLLGIQIHIFPFGHSNTSFEQFRRIH